MLVKTFGAAVIGIDAIPITVEVNIANGINFLMVGLPDSAVKESQQRIKAAFANNDYKYPGREITVNLAPADLRKEGSVFDLPIAIGLLAASEQLPTEKLDRFMILGELSLDGELRPLKGALSIAMAALREGFKGIVLPKENAVEAAMVQGLEIYGAKDLREVVEFFCSGQGLEKVVVDPDALFRQHFLNDVLDFNEVKGQMNIKRAFEIAAAGGHNILMIGPPGAGKSMLAKRLPGILPPMSMAEALESTKIHSVVGKVKSGKGLITERPFRKPHHTISDVALVGGGGNPQPGEISLAHNGVLFLDELPEYKRSVLEVMRQPMEDRVVTISRARFSVDFPAGFMLVAAMNPCPCGYYNHPERECVCGPHAVQRYLNKVSGPLLDRIDLHVEVTPVNYDELSDDTPQESSAEIRLRVLRARKVQWRRFDQHRRSENKQGQPALHANTEMGSRELRKFCRLDQQSAEMIKRAMNTLGLSARAYDKILKVGRTIADLDNSQMIEARHIAEAIQYRSLDKGEWGG